MVCTFSIEDRRRLAETIGVGEPFLYQCLRGIRSMKPLDARLAEDKTGGELKRWHLCQDWPYLWPELIGTEGAPPVPADRPKPSPKRSSKAEHAEQAADMQREVDKITRSACARRDGPSSEREGRG